MLKITGFSLSARLIEVSGDLRAGANFVDQLDDHEQHDNSSVRR